MNAESRDAVYKHLHAGQLSQQESQNRESARRILGLVFEYARPQSILDVGCGLGTWMSVSRELGVADVRGIEGQWLDPSQLHVERELVATLDLEQGFALHRKFDLAICLEVAEHVSEAAAQPLIASLAAHSDVILFSAAIPYQGGHHHVNEQFPDYWIDRFAQHGFRPLDFIRPQIWNDPAVLWWLRQNTLLFAHERAIAANDRLRQEAAIPRQLSTVHPDVYLSRLQQAMRTANEHAALVQLLSQGGTFDVTKLPDSRITITRRQPS
jgi:SAM-dependent methyltransferase